MFNDEFGDVYGLMYAVKGQGIAMSDLADTAEDIKRRLLKVPMVKKIDLYGKQAERIYIEFSHERLATLGITPAAIAESLRSQNSVLAAGSIDTRTDRVAVRVTGQFTTEEDIRNVPITAGGKLIKLGDFTTVRRGYEDPSTYTVRHNGQQVLMLAVVHDRRRQRRGTGRRPGEGRGQGAVGAAARRGAGASGRPADHGQGSRVGFRALPAGSAPRS